MYKKVLALDCDGTLWDGVVGEDGPMNVAPYIDFQKALLKVTEEQGILLVLVSKNNEEDVWSVFDTNPNMVLKREHIIAHRINWEEKSQTITEIADELNLGLDSFVFWDDNPIELEKMRHATEVIVPNIPADREDWPSYVVEEFYCDEITDADVERINYYKTNAKFLSQKDTTKKDEHEFLKDILMKAKVVALENEEKIARAVQLCAKTNQFNVRTVRHTKEEINTLIGNKNTVAFLMNLSDIYGAYGDVGLVIATKQNKTTAFIDTFLMSCRVMQRHLESYMLLQCCEKLQKKGYTKLTAEYIPTKRNGMTATFFEKHGLPTSAQKDGTIAFEGAIEDVIKGNTSPAFFTNSL